MDEKTTISLEDYLIQRQDEMGTIEIVGGSSLFEAELPDAISINGFHPECKVAAINSLKSDQERVARFDVVIAPWPKRKFPPNVIIPSIPVTVPMSMPPRQPTTYFSLVLICESLGLSVDLYGVCGRTTRHHYGDWEMHYMKHEMSKRIRIHDPRRKW